MVCDCLEPVTDKDKRPVSAYSIWCRIILSAFIVLPVPTYSSQYMICPKCGSQVTSVSNYCNYCGTNLKPQILLKICSNCKTRMYAAAKFCPECGQKQ